MRLLYIDIDSLRPDYLGCYGYHRDTSPNIDAVARQGVRFDNCYITDAPCLPSRTAMWSGRAGFHTGVVGHGGRAAQPRIEGPSRGFYDQFGTTSWMRALRLAGLHTATISSFGERHGAWHWYAGFNTRGELPAYLARLRATGRAAHAERLAARHPDELAGAHPSG